MNKKIDIDNKTTQVNPNAFDEKKKNTDKTLQAYDSTHFLLHGSNISFSIKLNKIPWQQLGKLPFYFKLFSPVTDASYL